MLPLPLLLLLLSTMLPSRFAPVLTLLLILPTLRSLPPVSETAVAATGATSAAAVDSMDDATAAVTPCVNPPAEVASTS
ncbi:MAG: hypothetical protein ACK4UY_16840, partial [Dietzia sp.]